MQEKGNNMKTNYNVCKMCIYSEYKKDGLWICTKHEKECNKLWEADFDCKKSKMLSEI